MKATATKKKVSYAKWGYLFILPFFLVFLVFQLVPLVSTFYYSFFEYYRDGLTVVGPNFVGLKNYQELLSADLPKYIGNTTILLMAAVMGISPSMFEAAELDGADHRQTFFKITLPLIRPILVYVLITSMIGGLQMFDIPQILTNGKGSPNRTATTVIMYLNNHLYSKNYGAAGAISVVLFIICAILCVGVYFTLNQEDEKKKHHHKKGGK